MNNNPYRKLRIPWQSKKSSLDFHCCYIWICCLIFLVISVMNAYAYIPFRILPCITKEIDHLSYIEGECVLQFVSGVPMQEKQRFYLQYGLAPIYHSPYGGFERLMLPVNHPVMSMLPLLRAEPIVLYAEPNYLAKVHFIPNDPLFRYQWNMIQIKADLAWNTANGTGVTIAVLDSGAAYEYFDIFAQAPDLAGTLFVPGWDFVNADANPDDDFGHGTHITGTIAQTTNNALGCAGVAHGSTIMPVKVLDNTGAGTLTNVVDGIYYATNNGAKILNMSFGFGNNPSITLQSAVQFADAAGAVMVCSAGNDSSNLPNYPASYAPCISVSGTIYDQTLASYSNYGLDIDLCAPGGDLTLDQNLDGYPDGILQQSHDGVNFTVFDYFSGKGTSWSAAHVSAVAAMVASVGGLTMTPLQIRNILESTALDIGAPGWDEYFGWGLVDASAALVAVQQTATVLSAAPLVPFAPLPLIPTSFPSATVAGYSIPTQPVWQNQSSLLTPARDMSFVMGNSPQLLRQWQSPVIFRQTYPTWLQSSPLSSFSLSPYPLSIPAFNTPLPFYAPFSQTTNPYPLDQIYFPFAPYPFPPSHLFLIF